MDWTTKAESKLHKELKLELASFFKQKGWRIDAVDGEGKSTEEVENNGNVGDGENKKPDIDAFEENAKRMIRGEAKTGDGDLDTEHSITQYRLFSNRDLKGISSWLFVIVPVDFKEQLEKILKDNLSESQNENVAVIPSQLR